MSKCSFCRNDNATNEHEYEGDFVFVMCDDCDARYKEHKQLGPKFLICKCDPDNPKELDLAMGEAEIKQNKPKPTTAGVSRNFNVEGEINPHKLSGYIPKDENDNKFKARQEEYKDSRRRKKV